MKAKRVRQRAGCSKDGTHQQQQHQDKDLETLADIGAGDLKQVRHLAALQHAALSRHLL